MLILVTGGSRSGKSSFALSLAEKREGPRTYIATAQACDDEMRLRIAAHRASRAAGWGLVEEPLRVPEALAAALPAARTVVLDCVTFWISNLLLADDLFNESSAEARAEELVDSVRGHPGAAAIVVTNEVGSGRRPGNRPGQAVSRLRGQGKRGDRARRGRSVLHGERDSAPHQTQRRDMTAERLGIRVPEIDIEGRRRAHERAETLLMPHRALGKLLDMGEKVAGIAGFPTPDLSRKVIVVMAGDHGVTEEGVSAYPSEVTGQMVHGFSAGVAGINVLEPARRHRREGGRHGVPGGPLRPRGRWRRDRREGRPGHGEHAQGTGDEPGAGSALHRAGSGDRPKSCI